MSKKSGRGPAKCAMFDKLRKLGPIPLTIKNGDTKVSCENASIFTGRVSWIVKHHANMSYHRWSDVPATEKEELCNRVRADFNINWEMNNHRRAVTNQLRRRFNSFHYDLHKIYNGYESHKAALVGGTSLVDQVVWRKLCLRWRSEGFKRLSLQNKANRKQQRTNHTTGQKSFVRLLEEKWEDITNLIEFFKESRWSKKRNKFVTEKDEELYNQMVQKLNELEPENRTKEAADMIFKEVMGCSSRYVRGMGQIQMHESSGTQQNHGNAGELSQDAQYYKSELEALKASLRVVLEKQAEFDKLFLRNPMSQQNSQGESPMETQGAD